jgi:hypothetical protein
MLPPISPSERAIIFLSIYAADMHAIATYSVIPVPYLLILHTRDAMRDLEFVMLPLISPPEHEFILLSICMVHMQKFAKYTAIGTPLQQSHAVSMRTFNELEEKVSPLARHVASNPPVCIPGCGLPLFWRGYLTCIILPGTYTGLDLNRRKPGL